MIAIYCIGLNSLDMRLWIPLVFFCFKQKTAYEMRISDWSSDVCSSDLCDDGRLIDVGPPHAIGHLERARFAALATRGKIGQHAVLFAGADRDRKSVV